MNAVEIVNELIQTAVKTRASDIHLEPGEENLEIRYRVDGLLQNGKSIPNHASAAITSRIKVMVGLDISEHRLPQDGRINLNNLDLRISTMPTCFGEKIVMRLLDRGKLIKGLEKLGMSAEDLLSYKSLIKKPQGIILVTGPTGSGKTTTLYSSLTYIDSAKINITTLENPVEYQLPHINQIQVNYKAGLNFATGLRGILRQDPDVIMVGEIRDKETARIAVQAALTGHLVLSTLHTNDAASSISRLLDMGIEPYLLADTLQGVVAQRLIRTLCQTCKGKGCETCRQTGYFGRTGIYEILELNSETKKSILKGEKLKVEKTLYQDGSLKVEKGITTRQEIARVCLN